MRKYLVFSFFLFSILIHKPMQGQVGYFKVGYQAGYMNPADINRVIYIYNQLHYNLDKQMPKVHFMHGYTVGFATGGSTRFEVYRTSRRALVTAEQGDTIRQLRVVSNTISGGVSLAASKHLDIGVSLDVGNFKGYGRIGHKNNLPDFDRLWVVNTNSLWLKTQLGTTAFVQFNFPYVGIRLFYQLQIMNIQLDKLDPWLIGGQIVEFDALEGKASNVGLELMFRIGNFKRE